MKINFKMDGGVAYLPAFSKPLIIDTTQTDPQVANQLESLVREARFFDQPAQTGAVAKGAADYKTYTLTVEDGPHSRTIQLTDPHCGRESPKIGVSPSEYGPPLQKISNEVLIHTFFNLKLENT
jgi:hypothetical protein